MSWIDDEILSWQMYESSYGREFFPVPAQRQVGKLLVEFFGDVEAVKNSILWNIRADSGLSGADNYWYDVLNHFNELISKEVNHIMLEET